MIGLVTLGAVFLAVTGARRSTPISAISAAGRSRLAWLARALPCAAAQLFRPGRACCSPSPDAIENPFYLLYPDWALLPMVGAGHGGHRDRQPGGDHRRLFADPQADAARPAAAARDPAHLGDAVGPDLHAARQHAPALSACCCSSFMFRSSSALASAYGIAVTGTMVVTAISGFFVILEVWKWRLWAAAALIVPFLLIDIGFLAANMLKVFDGGWVPLAGRRFVIVIMLTWRRGAGFSPRRRGGSRCPRRPDRNPGEEAAALRARHRRVPHQRPGSARRPRCCTASSTTRCCTSTTSSSPSSPRTCRASRPRTASDRAARRQLHARLAALRLHGSAERAEGARDRAQAGLELRHHVDVVLPVAALGARRSRARACRSGRTGCSSSSPRTPTMRRAISSSNRPRGRDRHAGHGVAVTASMAATASGNQSQSDMKRRSQVICRLA